MANGKLHTMLYVHFGESAFRSFTSGHGAGDHAMSLVEKSLGLETPCFLGPKQTEASSRLGVMGKRSFPKPPSPLPTLLPSCQRMPNAWFG